MTRRRIWVDNGSGEVLEILRLIDRRLRRIEEMLSDGPRGDLGGPGEELGEARDRLDKDNGRRFRVV